MEVWKIIFLSKWVICRFHVNLPGRILDLKEIFLATVGCLVVSDYWEGIYRCIIHPITTKPRRDPVNGEISSYCLIGDD